MTFKIFKFLFWICLLLLAQRYLFAMQEVKQKVDQIETISAELLKQLMDQKLDMVVVNVLNSETYRDCHIPGSQNITMKQLKKKTAAWPKDKHIVVHCASHECPLSAGAYKKLKQLGFNKVQDFEGGMREWKQKGYSVQGPCKAGYLRG